MSTPVSGDDDRQWFRRAKNPLAQQSRNHLRGARSARAMSETLATSDLLTESSERATRIELAFSVWEAYPALSEPTKKVLIRTNLSDDEGRKLNTLGTSV